MTSTRNERLKALDELVKATHFDINEVQTLINMFKEINNGQKLDRNHFREVLHTHFKLTDDMMMDRVFRQFTGTTESSLDENTWVRGMSIFLRGTQEEQAAFVFGIYDLNGDDYIAREEMFFLLKHTMVKPQSEEDRDEGIKDLVDLVLKKMDKDQDGRLSLDDYVTSAKQDPLLLEVLGPCLPQKSEIKGFMAACANIIPV